MERPRRVRQRIPLWEGQPVPGRKPGRPRGVASQVTSPKKAPAKPELPLMRIMSIDPGEKHNGVAFATLDPNAQPGQQLVLRWQGDWVRNKIFDELEEYRNSQVKRLDLIIIEEFRLYPWMAREQGFSSFETVEVIGSVKYIADRVLDVPYVMSKTSNKAPALAVAKSNQPTLVRNFRGKTDFVGSNQHERDALSHLVWYAWRDRTSPLYRDLKKGA